MEDTSDQDPGRRDVSHSLCSRVSARTLDSWKRPVKGAQYRRIVLLVMHTEHSFRSRTWSMLPYSQASVSHTYQSCVHVLSVRNAAALCMYAFARARFEAPRQASHPL